MPKRERRLARHKPIIAKSDSHSHSSGYRLRKAPGHPMARSNGWAYEHRLVAFRKYGPGAQACHWCGIRLGWPAIVVDHLNEVKTDNRPENLVVACTPCNRARGSIIPFIERMLPERVAELIDTFAHMRARKRHAA